jgi:S-adenosylmethionine:tRNA ribosyltransferase-isomerase
MMVVSRGTAEITHRHVADLPELLDRGDLLVTNDTTVIPARLEGQRRETRGRVQGLFLSSQNPGEWIVMLRSNGKLRERHVIELLDPAGRPTDTTLTLTARSGPQWVVTVDDPAGRSDLDVLEAYGRTPLPPYILAQRSHGEFSDDEDRQWYQTVFANPEAAGSVAAPTAGLHLTPGLLDTLQAAGVEHTHVTLHVGAGTFKPVTSATLDDHVMHHEEWSVTTETVNRLAACRGRVVAVGTTSVRVLESLPDPLPPDACSGDTDLLIAPPWTFSHVDVLMTNFHLPKSTLLALVAAMIGVPLMQQAYQEAIDRGYRFYSYGDAMLILP